MGKGFEVMEHKINDIVNTLKVNELFQKKEVEDKNRKRVIWALAAVGIVAVVAGIAFAVYRFVTPDYYEDDILDRTFYDVYINNKYSKTVNSTVFTIDFGDLDICNVYVVPTISNSKSNEVTVASTREYIFVSKNGSDNNKGSSRSSPVNTINKTSTILSTIK